MLIPAYITRLARIPATYNTDKEVNNHMCIHIYIHTCTDIHVFS